MSFNRNNQSSRPTDQPKYPGITPKDYFDNENNIVVDLFSEKANEIAKSFYNTKDSQIRKFYDEILKRKMIIELAEGRENKEKVFRKQLPYIKMLLAKVTYSSKRRNVDKNFKEFLYKNIGYISTLDEFLVFCDLFEAVVAYSKQDTKD